MTEWVFFQIAGRRGGQTGGRAGGRGRRRALQSIVTFDFKKQHTFRNYFYDFNLNLTKSAVFAGFDMPSMVFLN